MSGDPLGGYITDPQTLNKYSYVGNNPINMVDPSGMDGECSYVIDGVQYTYCVGNGPGSGGSDGGGEPSGSTGFGPYWQPTCAMGSCGAISGDAPGTRMYCLDEMRRAGATAKERTQMCPYQGSTAAPQMQNARTKSQNNHCMAQAWENFAIHGGTDALGFIPGVGGAAAALFSGYAVALIDSNTSEGISATSVATNALSTGFFIAVVKLGINCQIFIPPRRKYPRRWHAHHIRPTSV